MTGLALWQNRVAELKHRTFVAEAMRNMAIIASQRRHHVFAIELFIVHVIFESRLDHFLTMTFHARLVLYWKNDYRRLARDAGVMLERVPQRERDNRSASQNSFADVTIDTLDFLFASMKRSEVGCVLCFHCRARAIEKFGFRLRVTRRAKAIILFEIRQAADAGNQRDEYN